MIFQRFPHFRSHQETKFHTTSGLSHTHLKIRSLIPGLLCAQSENVGVYSGRGWRSSRLRRVRMGGGTCVRGQGEYLWWREAGRGISIIPEPFHEGETIYAVELSQTSELEYVLQHVGVSNMQRPTNPRLRHSQSMGKYPSNCRVLYHSRPVSPVERSLDPAHLNCSHANFGECGVA